MESKIVLNNHFPITKEEVSSIVSNYDSISKYIAKGTRNSIKEHQLENGKIITIKSFKIPNLVNKIIYRFFRKSKAERSFEYANRLINMGFNTPRPVAYFENRTMLIFLDSYYICELVEYDMLFRDLVETDNYPDTDEILKQFTKFTFDLHEAGIEFLDHSPGNTLIKKVGENKYEFYLVDLNRMNFHHEMSFEKRINNFSHIAPHKEMVEIIGKEYANLIDRPEKEVIDCIWEKTKFFQNKYYSKIKRKKRLKALIGKS